MPARVSAQIEASVLDAARGGMSDRDIAVACGVCERTAQTIRARNGMGRGKVGRPQLATPLTQDQLALVERYMEYARRIAVSVCREKSSFPSLDEDEYISVAYLALVRAASRWEERASFKTFCRAWVKGALKDWRRDDMIAHGWAWEDKKHKRMVRVLQITSCSELHGEVDQ